MKSITFLKYSIIFIVPILFFWVGSRIELAKFGNDPNYVYLINAAGLCSGHGVGYIDHPGTTVMQIGAATIAIKHTLNNPENEKLLRHVFKDPHSFVLAIRNVFLLMNSIILLLLGWVALKKTRLIWAALLLQAATLITTNSLDHVWTKISPAPVLFFITCIYIITILYFYADSNKNRWKYVIIFSLLVGAGIVTKATFVPLAVLPFIILPTFKKKLVYALGIIPSFVLFSIPIIPEYENMYYWFKGLSSHSGIYGQGNKGFIDWETFIPNIGKIMVNNPVFAFVFIIGFILVLVSVVQYLKNRKQFSGDVLILTGLVATSGAGILLVAKHYHSNHYLIPELLLTGISVFYIVKILQTKISSGFIKKYTGLFIVAVLIGFLIIKQPARIKYINEGYKMTNVEMDSTFALIDRDYPDYTKIYYYPISLNLFSALNFGNVYSKREMQPDLKEIYGNIYFFNTVTGTIQNWTSDVLLDDLVEEYGNKILLVSGPRDENEARDMGKRGFPLEKIYKGRLQAIYKLDTVRYSQFKNLLKMNIVDLLSCDMEITTTDNKKFLCSNHEEIGNGLNKTNETAHSGVSSLRMDENTEYAMEYLLKNLNAGEEYQVEIWQKSTEKSGLLVVSSNDSKLFYKAQNEVVKTDENGWQLLRLKFTVTPEIQNEILKIYLWNKDKQLLYFDDFKISKLNNGSVQSTI